MPMRVLPTLLALCSVPAGLSLSVWPKPQQQADTGVLHVIDQGNFQFVGAGAYPPGSPKLPSVPMAWRGVAC